MPMVSTADKSLNYTLSKLEFFRDQNGHSHCVVTDGEHKIIFDIPSKGLEKWVRRLFLKDWKKSLPPSEVQQIVNYIEAIAEDNSVPQKPYFTRVGQRKGALYYNLGNTAHEVVRTSKKGIQMLDNSEASILFKTSLPQVSPDLSAPSETLITRLRPFFRVSDDATLLLLCVYICTAFVYEISHPLLVVFGSKGSAKSTTIELVGRIIDPRTSYRSTLNPDRKSMVAAIGSRYFMAYDNLRVLKQWQSDLLCCASTGGSEPMRVLYTTSDVQEIALKSCIALNGISAIATEPDLLDRAILIELTRIPDEEYEPEDTLYKRFNAALPGILGAIFNALSNALKIYGTVDSYPRTRMQDFAKYGYCIAEAMGGYGEAFSAAYRDNKRRAEGEARLPLVAECLTAFMLYQPTWSGSATLLYEQLSSIAREKRHHTLDFPANPSALSREIARLKNVLENSGILVSFRRGNSRNITIKNQNENNF